MRGFRLIAMAHTVTQAAAQAINMGLDRLDAQLLLLHVLRKPPSERAWLLAHDTDVLTTAQHTDFMALVQRRAANEPLAYLTGHKEFYGLDLHVDRRVLVPRPDTETLVDWALEILGELTPLSVRAEPVEASTHTPLTVIDLGTGSGAVALAIKHSRPDVRVHATDFSTDALAVAQANAQRLGLAVEFSQGSWLSDMTDRFHLIVSNPPYIAARDPHLDALTHEPLQALASGSDGLDDIRQIIAQAPAHLHPEGWLLLEHGYDQADAVRDLLSQAGFTHVQSRCDLAGIERCSGGTWLNPCFARGSTQPDRS
jgi:release factor glutamine methyltransferase